MTNRPVQPRQPQAQSQRPQSIKKLQRPAAKAAPTEAWAPPVIRTLEDTGLNLLMVGDLVLKVLYFGGYMSGHHVGEIIKLPYTGVLDQVMEWLKREKFIDVRGSSMGLGESSRQYVVTEKGSEKAREALERSQYAGPAPVTLNQYIQAMREQNREKVVVHRNELLRVTKDLVISVEMLEKVGPAVNSGRSIFLFGPPGNGKTTIAERVGRVVLGDAMYIPYAIDIDGQTVQIFDNVNHEIDVEDENATGTRRLQTGDVTDPRWVRIKRPVIMVGGELTLEGLDLVYNDTSKFYEAPFQVKSNGGMFLIDDFGRQQVRPRDLLNRWIVPLEKGIDFLTLANGRKIEMPFFVMIVFSTNLDPADLVDEAFLRRIRHKIEVGDPDEEQFREIFKRMCHVRRIQYDDAAIDYLIDAWYTQHNRNFRNVHPRDILAQLIDIASYLNKAPTLDRQLLDMAAASYFVDL